MCVFFLSFESSDEGLSTSNKVNEAEVCAILFETFTKKEEVLPPMDSGKLATVTVVNLMANVS